MRRSARVSRAITAGRKARGADASESEPAPIRFVVYEDNGGSFRWSIVDVDGASLAESAPFTSNEEARQAARIGLGAVATSPSDDPAPATPAPVDLAERRTAAAGRVDPTRNAG